jgi:hypothetical protein
MRSTAVLLAALLLAGCSGTAGFEGPDPLTGGPPIQRRTSPAPSLAAGLAPPSASITTTGAAGQLPPVPTPSTATSQAALAGGLSQPLDSGGRDLRIGIGTPTALAPEQPLWRGTDPAASTPPSAARLNDPQFANPLPGQPAPIQSGPAGSLPAQPAPVQSGPAGAAIAPVSMPGPNRTPVAQPETIDQAFQRLINGRSVTYQNLESLDNGKWRFRCAIADPAKAGTERNFDATGATPLDAIHKAIDQITLEKL